MWQNCIVERRRGRLSLATQFCFIHNSRRCLCPGINNLAALHHTLNELGWVTDAGHLAHVELRVNVAGLLIILKKLLNLVV